MSSELLLAILAGIGGGCGWGIADFFAKRTIDQVGDITTLFWAQFLGVVPLVILLVLVPSIPQLDIGGWSLAAFLGIWSGLSYIPTYVAFGKGQVSLLSPIFASYAVVVTLLSAVFFNEDIPQNRTIAFGAVFAGCCSLTATRASCSDSAGDGPHKDSGSPDSKRFCLLSASIRRG